MATPGKTYAEMRAYVKAALLGDGQTEAQAEAALKYFDEQEAEKQRPRSFTTLVQRFYTGGNRRDN